MANKETKWRRHNEGGKLGDKNRSEKWLCGDYADAVLEIFAAPARC
jgi:hypothetical protein